MEENSGEREGEMGELDCRPSHRVRIQMDEGA